MPRISLWKPYKAPLCRLNGMCCTRIICDLTGLHEIGIRRVQTAVARCHTHTTWISQSSQLLLTPTTFLARIGDGLASSLQVILKTMIRMRECLSAHVLRLVLAWPGHHRFHWTHHRMVPAANTRAFTHAHVCIKYPVQLTLHACLRQNEIKPKPETRDPKSAFMPQARCGTTLPIKSLARHSESL